jgi:hypothetical protein
MIRVLFIDMDKSNKRNVDLSEEQKRLVFNILDL